MHVRPHYAIFNFNLKKRHPLFSLVALMFEKCELATSTPRDANIRDDICTSQTLEEDFNEFAKQVSPFFEEFRCKKISN